MRVSILPLLQLRTQTHLLGRCCLLPLEARLPTRCLEPYFPAPQPCCWARGSTGSAPPHLSRTPCQAPSLEAWAHSECACHLLRRCCLLSLCGVPCNRASPFTAAHARPLTGGSPSGRPRGVGGTGLAL